MSAELCSRYWARGWTFWQWVAVPISSAVPSNILREREQAMIQTLLNFPFIARWFCPKKGIIRPPNASLAKHMSFQRILRKRRRKLLLAQSSRGLPLPLNAIFDTPTSALVKARGSC